MLEHFFVIGLDPLRQAFLEVLPDPERYRFHRLLEFNEVVRARTYDYDALLAKARRRLDDFAEPIAGILGHWDFPTSVLLPHLCGEYGLRYASLESVLKCEHKYWSRLEQRKVLPEWTPGFCAVDPFAGDPLSQLTVDYPLWLKPIKAHSSFLGYRIETDSELLQALEQVRKHIHRFGNPFNQALAHITVPDEVGPVDGNWCIAEELLTGKQCGIEGTVLDGKYRVHGIVDTVKDSHNWSFTRYEYPSVWPLSAREKICAAGEKLLRHFGFDNAPFGIEFFWDEQRDTFRLLEINTRISQSHSDQFIKVHGVSNHLAPLRLMQGRAPDLDHYHGRYTCAAKFMLRRYSDTVLQRAPNAAEIAQLERDFPDSKIVVTAQENQSLSEQLVNDSYSYEIADIWLGAQSQPALLKTYQRLAERLHFEFSDGRPPEDFQFERVRY